MGVAGAAVVHALLLFEAECGDMQVRVRGL